MRAAQLFDSPSRFRTRFSKRACIGGLSTRKPLTPSTIVSRRTPAPRADYRLAAGHRLQIRLCPKLSKSDGQTNTSAAAYTAFDIGPKAEKMYAVSQRSASARALRFRYLGAITLASAVNAEGIVAGDDKLRIPANPCQDSLRHRPGTGAAPLPAESVPTIATTGASSAMPIFSAQGANRQADSRMKSAQCLCPNR